MALKKILLVDDDPDVRLAMHVRLKANGYDTCFASDALSSIAEARKQQPDVIILDLGLPGGDVRGHRKAQAASVAGRNPDHRCLRA